MKNIYEIISEQKEIVDTKLLQYDLDYVANYLIESQEEYYLEESVGESIKNASQKVIEFIKTLIKKIKEMFTKVINWFLGKKDTKAKLNKKIEDINNGTDSKETKTDEEDWKNLSREEILKRRKERKEQEKRKKDAGKSYTVNAFTDEEKKAMAREKKEKEKARRKASKAAYKQLDDIEAVMKACKGQVKMQVFGKLSDYSALGDRFYTSIRPVEREITDGKEYYSILSRIYRDTFKRIESMSGNMDDSIPRAIKHELFGDDHREITNYISVFADKVMEYLNDGDKVVSNLKKYEQNSIDSLNKLLIQAQRSNDGKAIQSIRGISTKIGEFSNQLLSSIAASRNIADNIANKAVEMYRDQIRGGDLPKDDDDNE
jgi:hypothetical protein